MTSLAKQLRQLAIPGQPTLKQAASKKRDSLLFDAEDAANKSRDHIHSLALNGLYELINMDESFSEFEATLFHDRFKEFERSSQTSEVLRDIDASLENFLRRLSPYFLHRMAQQCLEWLICVFRITKCNTDALMECVLPYYETKLFARVVQLLPLKDHTQKWYWLRPLRKTGSPLSKLALVQYCLSNKAFLHFICEMVPSSLKAHESSPARGSQKVISLYVSTVMAVLERASPVKEELILILLPYLEGGLKSSNRDYWASSCMIVSQLAVVASMKLDQKVLSCIVGLLSLGFDDMLRDSLCCLAVLCSHQKLDIFPKKVLRRLMNCDSLVSTLSSLSEVHSLTPLHSTLLSSLLNTHIKELLAKQGKSEDEASAKEGVASGKKEGVATGKKESVVAGQGEGRALSLLLKLLDEVVLEESVAHSLIKQLLAAGVLELHTAGSEKEQLDMLDNKVSFLHQFLSTSLPGTHPHGLGGAGLSLVLSVHHPNPSVRVDAINQLGKSLSSKGKVAEVSSEEREFISSSLISRLGDEDPAVVLAVLQLGPKILFACLPFTDFLPRLLALLTKKRLWHSGSCWQDCALASLSLLTSKHLLQQMSADSKDLSAVVIDIVIKSIPLLFLARNGNEFGGRVLEVLKTSALGKTNPVLKSLSVIVKKEDWKKGCMREHHKDEEVLATANNTIFTHLGEAVAHLDHDSMDKLLSEIVDVVCSTPTDGHEYYTLTTVAASAIKATPPTAIDIQHREAVRLLLHIQQNIGSLEGGVVRKGGWKSADMVPLVRKNADKAVSHRLLLLWSLEHVCESVLIPENLSRSMWLNMASCSSRENLYYNLLLTLLSTLTQILDLQLEGKGHGVTEPCKVMIQNVLKDHFFVRGSLLRFLAMVWTTPLSMEPCQLPVSGLSPALQASSLSIAHAYLMSLSQTAAEGLIEDMCPLVPSLLIPLASPHQLIRERALGCLQALHDACLPPSQQSDLQDTSQCPKPPLRLVQALLEFKVEIVSSVGQISQVLSKIHADFEKTSAFSLAPPPPPTPTPRRKSRRRVESATESAAESADTPACKQLNWLEFLLLHVVDEGRGMPIFIQCQFLRVLEKVDHVVKVLALGPLVSSMLNGIAERANLMETDSNAETLKDLWEYNALVLSQAIQCFTPTVASSLSTHPPLFQLLLRLLGQDTPISSLIPSPLSLTLQQVTPKFFTALGNVELQGQVLRALVDVILVAKSAEVTVEIKESMAKLPLSAVLVYGELNRDLHCLEKPDPPPTPSKRRRVKAATPPPTSSKMEGVVSWKRVTLVLELIGPACLKIPDIHTLVPLLFAILGRCLELEEETRFELEYTQQLLLSSLLSITSHLTSSQADITELIPEREFDVGVVVQCIRLSSNPQTHHHAYSFLSSAAAIFPHLVLHNVMPIFAFMGSSILRQDDQHSFQIITRTISSIIPPLIKSSSLAPASTTKKRTTSKTTPTPTTVEGVVAEIIRTFVNSIAHVPAHRQVLLFTSLVEQLGPPEYLHLALGLLLEKQAIQQEAVQQSKEKAGSGSVAGRVTTKLVVSIAESFPPAVQILAAFKLTQHLAQLPLTKPTSSFKFRQSPSFMFNVTTHTKSQLQQFKSLTLSTMTTLLSNKEFVSQVSSDYTADIEGTVIKFLQCVLGYVSVLTKAVSEVKGEGVAVQNLIRKAYLVVNKITSLLSFDAFLEVISQLVGVADEGVAGSEGIQEKALEMLNSKLQSSVTQFSRVHESYMLNAMDVLMGVACEDSTPQSSQCLSLDCIRLIVKGLAGDYHKKITKVLESVIVEMLSNSTHPAPVRSSCLQCLVEVCLSLGPHLLPLLSSLLPLILAQLDKKKRSKTKRHHVQLQASAVSALHSVVTTLPNFLGSSLPDIIIKLCSPALVCDDTEPTELEKQASSSRHELCTAVPVRNLLPAYLKCYHEIVPLGKSSVLALLSMLSTTVVQMSKEDSKSHSSVLLELFQACLDYRTKETKGQSSLSAIEEVECQCLEAFTALVVKLSEMQFRPVFLQLLDWATNPSSSPRTRAITFYHMADKVAERLKGLFLLFAGHFISNAVSLLDQNHKKKRKSFFFAVVEDSEEGGVGDDEEGGGAFAEEQSCLLLRYLLQCLTKCFLYDKSQFLTKERFDSLMQALVNQVSNQVGGAERYRSRVEQHLSPCVAQLAVAAGKESLWKPLNQQLLLKTKHKISQVRLGALNVLHELYRKLGEEMVVLLPETTPYLYELMEDDNEEVEKLTQEVIRTVEGICGETLQF